MRAGKYAGILKRLQPLIKLMTEIGQDYGENRRRRLR